MRIFLSIIVGVLLVACNSGAQHDAPQSVAAEEVTLMHVRFVATQAIFELGNRSSGPIAFEGNDTADMAFPRHYGVECRLPTDSQDDWSQPRPTAGSWTSTQTIEVPAGSVKFLSVDAQYVQQHAGNDCRLRLALSHGKVAVSQIFRAPHEGSETQ
jgi:hypothetical protein